MNEQRKPAIVKNQAQVKASGPAEDKPSALKLLEAQKAQISAALPRHMTPDRMVRVVTTEVRKNPELLGCDPVSFLGAIIQCSQLGLEPGNALGHAYLIPFWNSKRGVKEVQFIPGYRGLIDLARRSGQIVSISARAVHENDHFRYGYGTEEYIEHVPTEGEPGELTHVYAVAKLKDGGIQMEVMSRAQVEAIRTKGNNNPVWKSHYDEMARKTVVRRIFKYLSVSVEMAGAALASDQADIGDSQDNAQTLIDAGVNWSEPVTTPQEIDAQSSADNAERQRMEIFGKVEEKISEILMARGGGPEIKAEIEQAIGIPFDKLEGQPTKALLSVFQALKGLK